MNTTTIMHAACIDQYFCTYLAYGSSTIARGLVPVPVLISMVAFDVVKSKTPTISITSSVKYNLLLTQSTARPSEMINMDQFLRRSPCS